MQRRGGQRRRAAFWLVFERIVFRRRPRTPYSLPRMQGGTPASPAEVAIGSAVGCAHTVSAKPSAEHWQHEYKGRPPTIFATKAFSSTFIPPLPTHMFPMSHGLPPSPPPSPPAAPTELFARSNDNVPDVKVYGLSTLSDEQLESVALGRRKSIRRKFSFFGTNDAKDSSATPTASRKSSLEGGLTSSVSYVKPVRDHRRRMSSAIAPPGADWLTNLRDAASSAIENARVRSKAIIATAQSGHSSEAAMHRDGKRGRGEAVLSMLQKEGDLDQMSHAGRRRSSSGLMRLEAAKAGYDAQSLPRRASRIVLPSDIPEVVSGPLARPEHEMILAAVPEIARLPSSMTQITATAAFDQARYRLGDTIIEAGAPLDSLYLVKSGSFATYAKIVGDTTPLHIFRAGDRIGDRALVYTGISQYSIRCVESGEVLSILGDDYRKLMEEAKNSTRTQDHEICDEPSRCMKFHSTDLVLTLPLLLLHGCSHFRREPQRILEELAMLQERNARNDGADVRGDECPHERLA